MSDSEDQEDQEEKKTADDATPSEVIAATILRAYYDGKQDMALSRFNRGPNGLLNPPDDEMIVKLLWGDEDEALSDDDRAMIQRATMIADSILIFVAKGTRP